MGHWTERDRGVRLIITKIFIDKLFPIKCTECPFKGQGMNQMQFCSFYKRSHDEEKAAFCKVKWIKVMEDGGEG